jgi:hypothetical protein
MWIKAESGQVFNSRHISSLSVCDAQRFKCPANAGTWTHYHDAHQEGFAVVAWGKGGPVWLTGGKPARDEAESLFQAICRGFVQEQTFIDLSKTETLP